LLVVVVQQKWRDPLALASHYSRRVCYIYTFQSLTKPFID